MTFVVGRAFNDIELVLCFCSRLPFGEMRLARVEKTAEAIATKLSHLRHEGKGVERWGSEFLAMWAIERAFSPVSSVLFFTQADGLGWDDGAPLALELSPVLNEVVLRESNREWLCC